MASWDNQYQVFAVGHLIRSESVVGLCCVFRSTFGRIFETEMRFKIGNHYFTDEPLQLVRIPKNAECVIRVGI